MKSPSIWKQVHDENTAFVDQFDGGLTYDKAGLSEVEARLVAQKCDAKVLRGVTQTVSGWQVRFTINSKQEILFSCGCLPVAALMRDLLLTMLLRYSHCVKVPAIDPKSEHAGFNLPLATRERYAAPCSINEFLARVEKLLLDRGAVHPLTPEELETREQLDAKAKICANSAAQKRYHTRRATQLDMVLEQIQAIAAIHPQLVSACARLSAFLDRAEKTEASLEVLSQQIEFSTGQFESLKKAVSEMTESFNRLLDEARGR